MWKEIKLDEFLTQKKRHISIEPNTEYSLVTISNKGKVKLREVKNGATISAQTGYIAKEGDFIYSRLAVHTGAFGIVPAELDGAFITGEMPCFEINKNKILPEIFVKMIGLPNFLWQLKQLTKGMGRVRIKENMLLSTLLIMPDIKQQKEIVGRIKNIETEDGELKTELTYQQTLIKKLRQQILQEAIEGKLTAEWRKRFSLLPRGRTAKRGEGEYEHAGVLLERIIAEKNQMIKDKKIRPQKTILPISDKDKPFPLPPGWVWCQLGEVGYTQTGTTPATEDRSNYGSYISFVQPADIKITGVINYDVKKLSAIGIEKARLIKKGSVLMVCIGGSIGKSSTNLKDVTCNQQINTITPWANIQASFIQSIFQTPYFQLSIWECASGGTTPIVNKGKWERILIPLPPLAEQKAIVVKVEKLLALCDQLETKIAENKTHAEQLMRAVLKEIFAEK